MNGLWFLLLLIGISALPVLAVLIWLRLRRFPLSPRWFLLALLGGALALGIAAILQSLFPAATEAALGEILFKIFVQVALTEEFGRLTALLILFGIYRRFGKNQEAYTPAFGAAVGMISGLGFAVIETAMYGVGNFHIALIRAVTAAPLHGACGARIGLGAFHLRGTPVLSLVRFLYAVGIHGMYNFMIISPGIHPVFPILITLAAFFSSTQLIKMEGVIRDGCTSPH
jgi:RsiW-degrading membrane proteinase PrsW (M82 family)